VATVEAVSPLGRKMEALHETRERHLEELNRLRARVVELVRLEERTRDASVNVAPGQRSDEKGALSDVAKVIADRRKAEAEIVSLERELESVNRVAQEAAHGWRREQRETETRRARASQAKERAALETFCSHFVALAEAWLALRGIQGPRYAHTGAVRAGSLLNDMGPDESAAWDKAAARGRQGGGEFPEGRQAGVHGRNRRRLPDPLGARW
jgi:hypothetical protein